MFEKRKLRKRVNDLIAEFDRAVDIYNGDLPKEVDDFYSGEFYNTLVAVQEYLNS